MTDDHQPFAHCRWRRLGIATSLFLLALFIVPCISRSQEATNKVQSLQEPASFWTAIIDNDKMEAWQKGVALYLLFDRHVKQDMHLRELAECLDRPKWLNIDEVTEVTMIGGLVPIFPTPEDTLFCIRVFASENVAKYNRECIGIYVLVSGKIARKTFLSLLKHRECPKRLNPRLKGWAMSPTWDEYIKDLPRQLK